MEWSVACRRSLEVLECSSRLARAYWVRCRIWYSAGSSLYSLLVVGCYDVFGINDEVVISDTKCEVPRLANHSTRRCDKTNATGV